jgi:hypothetical protein
MISRANCRRSIAISSKIAKCNSMNSVLISKSRIPEAIPSVPHWPDSQTKRETVRAMIRRCKPGPLGAVPPGIAMTSMITMICAEFLQKWNDQLSDQIAVIHEFAAKRRPPGFRAVKLRRCANDGEMIFLDGSCPLESFR